MVAERGWHTATVLQVFQKRWWGSDASDMNWRQVDSDRVRQCSGEIVGAWIDQECRVARDHSPSILEEQARLEDRIPLTVSTLKSGLKKHGRKAEYHWVHQATGKEQMLH